MSNKPAIVGSYNCYVVNWNASEGILVLMAPIASLSDARYLVVDLDEDSSYVMAWLTLQKEYAIQGGSWFREMMDSGCLIGYGIPGYEDGDFLKNGVISVEATAGGESRAKINSLLKDVKNTWAEAMGESSFGNNTVTPLDTFPDAETDDIYSIDNSIESAVDGPNDEPEQPINQNGNYQNSSFGEDDIVGFNQNGNYQNSSFGEDDIVGFSEIDEYLADCEAQGKISCWDGMCAENVMECGAQWATGYNECWDINGIAVRCEDPRCKNGACKNSYSFALDDSYDGFKNVEGFDQSWITGFDNNDVPPSEVSINHGYGLDTTPTIDNSSDFGDVNSLIKSVNEYKNPYVKDKTPIIINTPTPTAPPFATGTITYNESDKVVSIHTIGKSADFNLPDLSTSMISDMEQIDPTGGFVSKKITSAKLTYVAPVDPENTGAMYIGDILFTIPPTNMRFSFINEAMSIPTMRTKGDPITSSNNSIPKVTLTLYFNGRDQINNQLRPLVALFQNMPFTSVQNTTIFDSWTRRADLRDEKIESDRFMPVPCYLENINFSTVPGFPNTVQAHLNLIMMETSPFSAGLIYWKKTKDALDQAVNKGIRQSMGNKILSSSDTKTTKNNSVQHNSQINVYTTTGEMVDMAIKDDPEYELKTIFPQESHPFSKMYRNRLVEEKNTYSKIRRNPVLHWNKYEEADNDAIYLSYRSPTTFTTAKTKFIDRYERVTQNLSAINILFSTIGMELTDASKVETLFETPSDLGVEEVLKSMMESLSISKTWEAAQAIIKESWMTLFALGAEQMPGFYKGFTIEIEVNGKKRIMSLLDIYNATDVEIPFIEDGKMSKPVKDILNQLHAKLKDDILSREEPSTPGGGDRNNPDSLKFIHLIIDNLINDPLLNDETPSNPENYRNIEVKLGWSDNPSTAAAEQLIKKGEFPGEEDGITRLEGTKVKFEFQSVIQSISYSYGNSFSPKFVVSSKKPSYQHMGISNAIATISLRTRDERLLKVINDIREAAHEAGKEILSGNFAISGFDAISLTGIEDSSYSGHLLNCFGFKDCNITNIDSKSLEGFPGWWEISIDLVENNTYLRSWETFTQIPSVNTSILNNLRKATFPFPYINLDNTIYDIRKDTANRYAEYMDEEYVADALMEEIIKKVTTTIIKVGSAYNKEPAWAIPSGLLRPVILKPILRKPILQIHLQM